MDIHDGEKVNSERVKRTGGQQLGKARRIVGELKSGND